VAVKDVNNCAHPSMTINRWLIAVAGVVMQIALGAVYAWSVFRVPLSKQFGWSISELTLTFRSAFLFWASPRFAVDYGLAVEVQGSSR
jgi:hypothetical protein